MCTLNESLGKSFCSGSCPVSEGNIVCGERRTLDIINEFKRLYENKMDEINKANCGDCLQEKLKLQQDWINDLSEQNELLVKAVEELEIEATERVKMLEDKLQRSAECICEVMKKYRETDVANSILEEPRRKIFNLENDVKNLLEFLRRIREEQQWSTGGLVFYEISEKDLLGDKCVEEILNDSIQESLNSDLVKGRKKIVEQDRQLHDLERRTSEVEDLSRELKSTREECETLQKNMADMRQVLTEEVAVKHDAILKLKREYQELEERCIQADKQTAFRDDIIKELRKEIKQLKQQVTSEEVIKLNKTIDVLQSTLERSRALREEEEKNQSEQTTMQCRKVEELESCICELQEQLQISQSECCTLIGRINELECSQNARCEIPKTSDVSELETKVKELEASIFNLQSKGGKLCKVCKQSMKVGFIGNSEVQTDAQEPAGQELESLLCRDELIKCQSCTLQKMQQELERLCQSEKELLQEKRTICSENCSLQDKIAMLEKKLMENNAVEEELMNKEKIIKKQREALSLLQKEVEGLRRKEAEVRDECENRCRSVEQFRVKINELEEALRNAETRGDNLQTAVDLYTNTLNVLEASEEKHKLELDHQRTTIANLQEVLIATKHELEEYKHKYDDNMEEHKIIINQLTQVIASNESEKADLKCELLEVSQKYEKLREINFGTEIEHCHSLQDVQVLDNQLYKYQSLLKFKEEELNICKCNLKKMLKQKKNFERLIEYFRTEMIAVSQQLQNLQDVMNISHETTQLEVCRLTESLMRAKEINQKLFSQLSATEQKLTLQDRRNQFNQSKIMELERTICEKEVNLLKHSEILNTIKNNLHLSLQENSNLKDTIKSLNQTVLEFEEVIKQYESESFLTKEKTSACKTQIDICKNKLLELNAVFEQKTREFCSLECAYNQQHKSLKTCQMELNRVKEKEKTKKQSLQRTIEQLKDQLSKAQEDNKRISDDSNALKVEFNRKTCECLTKEAELDQYRKVTEDLKLTLDNINKSLNGRSSEDDTSLSSNCKCDFNYYLEIIASLKLAVTQLLRKLSDSYAHNEDLKKQLDHQQHQLTEAMKNHADKDRKFNEIKQKFVEVVEHTQIEEQRYIETLRTSQREIHALRQDLDERLKQINEMNNTGQETRCNCTGIDKENACLKDQLSRLMKQQHAESAENENLRTQIDIVEVKISTLEESNRSLKTKMEQYSSDMERLNGEKECLHRKNEELLGELKSLSASFESATSQKRYKEETIRALEDQLNEVKISRDEICFESKNALNYFKRWLQEQNRINKHVVAKERNYCKTIDILKHQIEQGQYHRSARSKDMSPLICEASCSLGSQGNESVYSGSPPISPNPQEADDSEFFTISCKNDDWDTDEDDGEGYVAQIEHLTKVMKKTNEKWKEKSKK
ncbi:unnamed protein product [Phyllotreta striolata]|uniref:Uncharacterized protein n=1 Tax=Phyllotreta striolata TaxID=444603 RepID=A0A9N9TNY4_PHYSR|nr:unnamed protein product [Phyllotreta striolata]